MRSPTVSTALTFSLRVLVAGVIGALPLSLLSQTRQADDPVKSSSAAARGRDRAERAVQIIEVRWVDAEKLARIIESTLALWQAGPDDGKGAGDGKKGDARGVEQANAGTEPGSSRASAVPEGFKILADRRSNGLVITAPGPALLAEIRKLVVVLDRNPRVMRRKLSRTVPVGQPATLKRFSTSKRARRGQRVDILDGKIPLKEFMRFLADYTGLAVIVEESPQFRIDDAQITVAAPIRDADDILVEALIEAAGWMVERKKLTDTREVLRVWHIASQSAGVPEERPIIKVPEK